MRTHRFCHKTNITMRKTVSVENPPAEMIVLVGWMESTHRHTLIQHLQKLISRTFNSGEFSSLLLTWMSWYCVHVLSFPLTSVSLHFLFLSLSLSLSFSFVHPLSASLYLSVSRALASSTFAFILMLSLSAMYTQWMWNCVFHWNCDGSNKNRNTISNERIE